MTRKASVRIGCASGFWGDSPGAAKQLVDHGELDVLVFDYLAEMTLSIMAKQRMHDATLGYAQDFVSSVLRDNLPAIATKGIKIIANAGGLNPRACATAIEALLGEFNLKLKVAVVTGDDIHGQLTHWSDQTIEDPFDGQSKPESLLTANAYLGSHGIVEALNQKADIVITGRCADSALVIAPLIHAFGWSFNNYDRLAQAALAGHLIECGAQCTGGNYSDWESIPDFHTIGYPIIEASPDGSFYVTKPPNTGGMVTPATLSEQLIYEIDDPTQYPLPDVVVDFSDVQFTQIDHNKVQATGARGHPPSTFYKVASTWENGYKVTANLLIAGENILQKSHILSDAILKRVNTQLDTMGIPPIKHWRVDCLGTGALFGRANPAVREAIIRLAADHESRAALTILSQEIAQSITSMVPGIAGMGGGRPKVSSKIELFTFLHPKSNVTVNVEMQQATWEVKTHDKMTASEPTVIRTIATPNPFIPSDDDTYIEVPLSRVAYARSGDKGDRSNIGIIARTPSLVPFLWSALSVDWMIQSMNHVFSTQKAPRVDRYFLPGISAINFVLHHALGGGGFASLNPDPQGKTYAQQLLTHLIHVPSHLLLEQANHATDTI